MVLDELLEELEVLQKRVEGLEARVSAQTNEVIDMQIEVSKARVQVTSLVGYLRCAEARIAADHISRKDPSTLTLIREVIARYNTEKNDGKTT